MSRITESVRLLSLAVVLVVASTAMIGCESKSPDADPNAAAEPPTSDVELVVLCGSSFVNPTNQLIEEFKAKTGVTLVPTVAGSEDFLPLVKVGSKGDILVTHDPYLDYVTDANALADSVHVGFVAPVLAVQPGNPKALSKIEDLANEGLRVGLTDPQYSTAGEMVFALIEKKQIKDAVLKNVGNRLTKGHSTLGTYVKTQVVDAVVMWNGVAHTFKDSVEVVKTPYEYDEEIRVHVIGLDYTKHPEELKQFIEFVNERGPDVFSQHGYVK